MTPWIRKLHKWVGLIIALQFVVWTASGLTMSLLDADIVAGHQHRTDHADGPRAWPTGMLSPARVVAMAERPGQTVEAFWLQDRSEEHTSELQSLMRTSYAVFCLKKKKQSGT